MKTKGKAVFVAWQAAWIGEKFIAFPLFNVDWKGHPRHQSTLSPKGLAEVGIEIPDFPNLTEKDIKGEKCA